MEQNSPRPERPLSIDVVLATGNRDKVRELQPMLDKLSPLLRVWSLADLSLAPEIDETEPTLEGNAWLKAEAIFSLVQSRFRWLIVIADDTGLEVDCLQGAPGVRSARFAPVEAGSSPTYDENVTHLLKLMEGCVDRAARFRTVIAMKGRLPSTEKGSAQFEESVEGKIEGTITTRRHGDGGFGYDPLFMPAGMEITFAQISLEEKNRISHRALAVARAALRIREILHRFGISSTETGTNA
ncbi:MAG: RdgB/HAM1 family non-canonical purine NTP pyrophosphatase [Chlorobiaceae bacterium]|nr:RdgB/HAM1 family non-canonical purine NTP pyrophosphatase [Chlorobiaceae bacterium]